MPLFAVFSEFVHNNLSTTVHLHVHIQFIYIYNPLATFERTVSSKQALINFFSFTTKLPLDVIFCLRTFILDVNPKPLEMYLPRPSCVELNHLRTGVGLFRSTVHR